MKRRGQLEGILKEAQNRVQIFGLLLGSILGQNEDRETVPELTPNLTGHKQESDKALISPHSLRKELETELSSDSKDIRSYAWFHGRIPRDISEQLLRNDGDFLIRESISSTGEFVLTMKWNVILHFMIKKIVLQHGSPYSKIQFAFEREGFDSVPALIMYHKGNNIPISTQSGAIIRTPINREVPLSFSDVKYASIRRSAKSKDGATTSQIRPPSSPHSNGNAPSAGSVLMQTDQSQATDSPIVQRTVEGKHRSNPNPFPLHIGVVKKPESLSRNRTSSDRDKDHNLLQRASFKGLDQSGSEQSIKSQPQSPSHQPPRSEVPPKPSRIASFRRPIIRHSSARTAKSKVVVERSDSQAIAERNTPPSEGDGTSSSIGINLATPTSRASLSSADYRLASATTSIFNPLLHNSILLPDQNKPVDGDAMLEVKKILLETDSFKLARHMTFKDCEVCRIMEFGLEDIYTAKGKQFRKDLLERYQSLSFWIAVCVLRGGTTKEEQIKILNVFIMVANELVHSLGNVYGFSAIMHGLTCPQIRGLDELWMGLQQQYTNNAVTMQNKLVPLLRLLDEGKGHINSASTCVPHILPLLRFFENPLEKIPHSQSSARASDRKQLSASEENMPGSVASTNNEEYCWWENIPDNSFDSLMAQLSIARSILSSLQDFKTKFVEKFKDFNKKNTVLEIFDTEFHLRLLWGHKGSVAVQKERHEKFDKLITLMAKRNLVRA